MTVTGVHLETLKGTFFERCKSFTGRQLIVFPIKYNFSSSQNVVDEEKQYGGLQCTYQSFGQNHMHFQILHGAEVDLF